jgi:hypothetical protein
MITPRKRASIPGWAVGVCFRKAGAGRTFRVVISIAERIPGASEMLPRRNFEGLSALFGTGGVLHEQP